jgi:hypothetical protein
VKDKDAKFIFEAYLKPSTDKLKFENLINSVKDKLDVGGVASVVDAENNLADDMAERILGAGVKDPVALLDYYVRASEDVPEPFKHDELKKHYIQIKQAIDNKLSHIKQKAAEEAENLIGGQKKLDANHDGKITAADFNILRKK